MKWEGRQESGNVEDRRGVRTMGLAAGGAGSAVLLILGLVFGFDPRELGSLLEAVQVEGPAQSAPYQGSPAEERMASFTKVVLRDTEVVWEDLFRQMRQTYRPPVLVLFTGGVRSACGFADVAVGPFYCPGDDKVYIDLSFYADMETQLQSPGEFARAYVIAHEVGHHVQRLLGYSDRVDEARERVPKAEARQMGVRQELQADFLAGVWAHHGQRRLKFLEPGDIESALNAAFEIGDDRLQKKQRGQVVPDSFTHGSSRQRMRWFNEGFEKGDVLSAGKLFDLAYEQL